MDIVLERILSLLPRKEDGKFVRGAKKDFATSIGFDSGDIISMWISGSSTSYRNYLYQISAKYNVSVEWLKGETDQKEKPAPKDELDEDQLHIMIRQLPKSALLDLMDEILKIVKEQE